MISVRLTETAKRRLDEIGRWTIENFGVAQWDRYENDLLQAVQKLARGEGRGRSCAAMAPQHPGAAGMYYLRAGQHYLIYWVIGDEIEVLDFVHSARDLPALLAELSAAND